MNPSCSVAGGCARPTARFQHILNHQQQQRPPTRTIMRPMTIATARTTTTMLLLVSCLAFLSTASAAITCALPAGGTYKAGDGVILDWGSDGTSPVVKDIIAVNGTLYCNSGNVKVVEFPIPSPTGAYNYTLPSVGNATTVGGTVGECAGNAFHMEYAGMANGFLGISKIPWGPVQCGTIYILPAPNGTVTTTTTTMSSTSTAIPTSTPDDKSSGGLSTTIIVVIAVVAAVIVTLSIVGVVVCLRRKRRQRKLNNAFMPWNANSNNNVSGINNSNNRFSKISNMDDGLGSESPEGASGSGAGTNRMSGITAVGGGSAAGGLAGNGFPLKPPRPPRPQTPSLGLNYFGDERDYNDYGYQQQELLDQQQQPQGQQGFQQGYENYDDVDAYYNPYYASGVTAATTTAIDQNTLSYYSQASGSGTVTVGAQGSPYGAQDPYLSSSDLYLHQQIQQQQQQEHQRQQQHQLPRGRGYIPPPPTIPLPPLTPPPPRSSGLNSLPIISFAARNPAGTPAKGQDSGPLGSSPNRGPQVVREEMGRKEAEADDVSLEEVTTDSKVEVA
ncbi:hypothetical protein K457DRAFT_489554 [Linnemannia elongata AG-77]|uniref:Uncharacterized protein n=1 Tax=Linnemannia elongata AG-77 TaxID=1314771 RepID=A0A197KG65_9FUNG|nr:hypothetical protein K457DRAFT_489554 [Linnemannia elongata AG-77]